MPVLADKGVSVVVELTGIREVTDVAGVTGVREVATILEAGVADDAGAAAATEITGVASGLLTIIGRSSRCDHTLR